MQLPVGEGLLVCAAGDGRGWCPALPLLHSAVHFPTLSPQRWYPGLHGPLSRHPSSPCLQVCRLALRPLPCHPSSPCLQASRWALNTISVHGTAQHQLESELMYVPPGMGMAGAVRFCSATRLSTSQLFLLNPGTLALMALSLAMFLLYMPAAVRGSLRPHLHPNNCMQLAHRWRH